jgi:hypothetical protein
VIVEAHGIEGMCVLMSVSFYHQSAEKSLCAPLYYKEDTNKFMEAASTTNDGFTRSGFHKPSYYEKSTNTYIIKLLLLMT